MPVWQSALLYLNTRYRLYSQFEKLLRGKLSPVSQFGCAHNWCATRQVDKLNNENFSSPVQFMYRVVYCSRSKFLTKLLKTFDKTFQEIFPVFISTKRREKPSAFFDNNFVNNAYFSEAASSSSSHLASSSSKAPISSRMTCLCLWSS